MKFRSLSKWDYDPATMEGLLFFVQRLDELLFEFTLDTYRPSALNTPFLCKEALNLIKEIEKGVLDDSNLKHVLEELEWSLRQDIIAKKLIEFEPKHYVLNNENDTIQKKKLRLEILYHAIKPSRYVSEIRHQLKVAIEASEKKKIDYISRTYITTLRNRGFSTNYLSKRTLDYFYYGNDNRISSIDIIDGYFELFDHKSIKYQVLFIVDSMFNEIQESCKVFKVEVGVDLPEHVSEKALDRGFTCGADSTYVLINVQALDPLSAREVAERRLEKLRNLFVFYHHKNVMSWNDASLVFSEEGGEIIYLEKPISAMKKSSDKRPESAAWNLNYLIKNFSLQKQCFEKFDRVVDLHGMAISNDTPENQLLNIWISLETLVPTHPNRNKINNIISLLVPLLMLNYTDRLIRRVTTDLLNWNRPSLWKIIKDIPQSKLNYKIASLLIDESLSGKRDDLYKRLNDFILLRNRFFTLHTALSDPKKYIELLETHKTKVEWQLRRIYRTRNLIVHSAQNPTYTHSLIENSHDYLDQLLTSIVNYSTKFKSIDTIDQCFELAALRYEEYQRRIKNTEKDKLITNIGPNYFPNEYA